VQVVSEVYALHPVKVEPHVVLSLVLYKMVDSSSEVREDALHMLHVLSTREWQASAADISAAAAAAGLAGAGGWRAAQAQQQQQQQQQQRDEVFALEAEGGSGTVVVLGALQDSYQQFQYQLAVKLARWVRGLALACKCMACALHVHVWACTWMSMYGLALACACMCGRWLC
jgi:hypothetical protein